MDPPATDPRELALERRWDLYVKNNVAPWTMRSMQRVFRIATVADMWGALNNMPPKLVSNTNLFVMQQGTVPLAENNGPTFRHGGGCWSVVVRRVEWRKVLNDLVMSLVGEIVYSEAVLGACFVPVSLNHVICKIWATRANQKDGAALGATLAEYTPSQPRFKRFDS